MPLKFSIEEAHHLLYAWAALSFAFGMALSGGLAGVTPNFPVVVLLSALIIAMAFILHELAHKFVAQRYGCWAEFRRFDMGLLLAVGLSFFGFIIAAPGAVMINGLINARQNGLISVAGPATNIVLALFFLFFGGIIVQGASLVNNPTVFAAASQFVALGFTINAWLALFNLIPFGPLDGAKVMEWSVPVWGVMAAGAAYLVFFA